MSFIIHVGNCTIALMNLTYIELSKALDLMDQIDEGGKPATFQVKFVTANRIRRTGGEIIEIQNGRKCVGNRNGSVVFDTRTKPVENPSISRNPDHWANSTRNILLPNGGIRKIHISLIMNLKETYLSRAHQQIENALKYISLHGSLLPIVSLPKCPYFIRNVDEFQVHFDIHGSRRVFILLMPIMGSIEQKYIRPTLYAPVPSATIRLRLPGRICFHPSVAFEDRPEMAGHFLISIRSR